MAGSSGFLPILLSGQAWSGNPSFAFEIQRAPAGTTGLLAVSQFPAASGAPYAGIHVGLAPMDLVLLQPFTVSGVIGTPVPGSATVTLPLGFPPSLAGAIVYAQAGMLDGTLVTTNALRVELTLPPLLVVATSSFGGTPSTVLAFVDPEVPTLIGVHGPEPWTTQRICFGPGGRDLFVASTTTIWHAAVGTLPLVFSPIFSSGSVNGVACDRRRNRIYTIATPPGGAASFVALEGDPTSPAFGSVLAYGGALLPAPIMGSGRAWDLADATDVAAVVRNQTLELADMDPASPSYLQILGTRQIPNAVGSVFSHRDVQVTADGEVANVLFREPFGPTGLFRFHVLSGTWIDHNDPGISGIQPLGPMSAPPVQDIGRFTLTRDGFGVATLSQLILSELGLIVFPPGFPTAFGAATVSVPFSTASTSHLAFSGDRRRLAFVSSSSVQLLDLATLTAFGPLLSFAGAVQVTDVAFR